MSLRSSVSALVAAVAEIITFPVAFPKPDYEPIVLPEFPGSRDAS